MTPSSDDKTNQNEESGSGRPATEGDGPVQTRKNPDDGPGDRQIAQEPQQSTGLGSGQT
jgi:hypothetical protein